MSEKGAGCCTKPGGIRALHTSHALCGEERGWKGQNGLIVSLDNFHSLRPPETGENRL